MRDVTDDGPGVFAHSVKLGAILGSSRFAGLVFTAAEPVLIDIPFYHLTRTTADYGAEPTKVAVTVVKVRCFPVQLVISNDNPTDVWSRGKSEERLVLLSRSRCAADVMRNDILAAVVELKAE